MRHIEIDVALLYLVSGALLTLLDNTELEQTGTLTVIQAKEELAKVFYATITQ